MSNPHQRAFLPVEITTLYASSEGSKDLKQVGKDEAGITYAIKRLCDGRGYIPASELFCYELASMVNIPTPNYSIVSIRGELAFGSIWEDNVLSLKDQNDVLAVLTGQIPVLDLDKFFSKVYAFDLFINNIDRHPGNYLFKGLKNGSHIALAYDYSRAWYEVNHAGFECTHKDCRTKQVNQEFRRRSLYDPTIANETLEKIAAVDSNDVANILLHCMPENWMRKEEKNIFLAWWGSPDFSSRIYHLRSEVA